MGSRHNRAHGYYVRTAALGVLSVAVLAVPVTAWRTWAG